MSKSDGYIYSEGQYCRIEGPFTIREGKWCRSLKKRASALRGLFSKSTARLRERIVEYPLVLAAMAELPPGRRVADLGGASGLLGAQLVYFGHEVHVLDLRPYPMRHPRLTSQQIDIFDNNLADDYFDAVSCISVIEHVGIERYGGRSRQGGDFDMVREIQRLIRPGGLALISAPYGRGHDPLGDGKPSGYRIYDRGRLEKLTAGFHIESLRFFVMENGSWIEREQEEADNVPTSRPIDAIFFARLRKKG